MNACIQFELQAHCRVAAQVAATMEAEIEAACELAIRTLEQGKKILLFGNGGSAADAQHIAAEFTGRYRRERRGLPAIALSTDTSALTAIGNDYGFDRIFSRQVEALASEGDLLVGFSTSGESPNVIAAFEQGRALGCATLGFTGKTGGAMRGCCDVCLVVPSDDTARIQEMHILLGHTLCQIVETAFCAAQPAQTLSKAA